MSSPTKLNLPVMVDSDSDACGGGTRYEFELSHAVSGHGEVTRKFIIDLPLDDEGTVDVWVLDHLVEVGDTPEDGFATYVPVSATIGANVSDDKPAPDCADPSSDCVVHEGRCD